MLTQYLNKYEVGLDEAGRGCWWGPVTAGAVMWPENLTHPYLTDSKKLTEKKRNVLYTWILEKCLCGIGEATSYEIDTIGILEATKLAMNRAIKNLEKNITMSSIKINNLIIDGINWKEKDFPYPITSIVKGDGKYYSIAAASVLAKVYRDNYCYKKALEDNFKTYLLDKHKGYGTKIHKEMLDKYGPTEEHRHSFKPICNMK
ncbi:putative ribonuclease HII [Cafeteria roenbergensis virus]|uniref:Ribonuclease HII n=1 Tax=Cafeteria roenbergensis virus (strain BV-PW1) TaxID=693272 RepID=E3T5H8_CROVB|nr:putative ribonuclease HII [Cafeteria roenbergensis virus BV-PW1]ADO67441.1 putative ribonuclease HII [Cafeteria roenbergensis virus BV-PW1]